MTRLHYGYIYIYKYMSMYRYRVLYIPESQVVQDFFRQPYETVPHYCTIPCRRSSHDLWGEWLGISGSPRIFVDASSCFTDFFSVPLYQNVMLKGQLFFVHSKKTSSSEASLCISLIFSFGTTRFILGEFHHLRSHGPID